jgi:hypothetical protein
VALAAGGMVLATMVLTYAAVATSGSWLLFLLGVALSAVSVRAARIPSAGRLLTLGAITIASLTSIQAF